jgi:hypothetical protein
MKAVEYFARGCAREKSGDSPGAAGDFNRAAAILLRRPDDRRLGAELLDRAERLLAPKSMK